jgi:ABC-2 type transport system permease protein
MAPLEAPGARAALIDLVRHRYLLRLLTRQQISVRYSGAVLGLLWTYIKPALQFAIYFVTIGVFLRVGSAFQNFALYLFTGLVMVNFASEIIRTASRSIIDNAPLVKKVYLPRELFPVTSLLVAWVHLAPQLAVLGIGACALGWTPSLSAIGSGILALTIVSVAGLGIGLAVSAVNVFFRDIENIIDSLLMVAAWASPVLYPWSFARDALGQGLLLQAYLANPLTIAVQLFQRALWAPTVTSRPDLAPDLWARGGASLAIAFLVLAIGQLTFRRLEGRFAQEL